jgi:hypothetical protein
LRYKKEHFRQFSKSLVAVLLVGMVLFVAVLASSESLHKLIHSDADEGRPSMRCHPICARAR